MQNKKYFIDYLIGHRTENVLFEPFINRLHVETLIWRRGRQLWSTPEAYVDTLISLSRRARADVVFCDMRSYTYDEKERLLRATEAYAGDDIGFAVICDQREDLEFAETFPSICSAAVYGEARSERIPVIRMDGSLSDAIGRGDSGWYARDNAEQHLQEANGSIRILGGLGGELFSDGEPVKIYTEVERLAASYPGQWACGSGGEISDKNYLELISLLGAFGRIRL